jgi:hypothetical protein
MNTAIKRPNSESVGDGVCMCVCVRFGEKEVSILKVVGAGLKVS